jgi:hypothetical protein
VHEASGKLRGKPRPNGNGAFWDPQGKAQPKFLETAARVKEPEAAKATADAMANGGSLGAAVLAGGEVILEAAKEMCPVDSGTLQSSGYVYVQS